MEYNKTNELIIEVIKTLSEPKDAEFLWLEFTKKAHKMSISSFYGRLKKLVEAELIVKTHAINNKFIYNSPSNKN
ncbi:Fe2+ or Zn2+ uptake regulation protein [Mucilaginibacter sp. UYCu711]